MPGQFSLNALPVLPGAYVDYIVAPGSPVPVSTGSVVALVTTSDWGPFQVPTLVGSLAEYTAKFGPTTTTPGYIAVANAFRGEGVSGRGGAGAVLVHRTGAPAKATASHAFLNTTPAAALTISAKYPGVLGNAITITVQDYAADASKTQLIVYLSGTQVEQYIFADTNVLDAANQINANSSWITAVETVTGVVLTAVSNVALTGGNDGSTLTSTEWTNALNALSSFRFGIFAPFDLTDTSIQASIKTWQASLNNGGQRFMTVLGGALNESYSTAKTRATTMNDWNIVTLGVGSVSDSQLLDTNGNPQTLSTSQLAPRVAGIIANRGEAMSLTFSRMAGLTLLAGGTLQNLSDAFTDGLMLLESDSNANPVKISRGRTTYGTALDAAHPVSVFREPKFVRTMQNFEMEIVEWAEGQDMIGILTVNDQTRQTVLGEMRERLRKREDANVIQPGWTVATSASPPPSDDDQFVALDYSIKFGRSMEQILNSITVG